MKLGLIILLLMIIHHYGRCQIVIDSVFFTFKDLPLDSVFTKISDQTHINFSYNTAILPFGSLFTYNKKNTLSGLLDEILVGTGLIYSVHEDQIIVRKAITSTQYFTIQGSVLNNNNQPIPNVNVYLDGTLQGATSSDSGKYRLKKIPIGTYTLVFSHVGYEINSFRINANSSSDRLLNVRLNDKVIKLEQIDIVADPFEERTKQFYVNSFERYFLGKTPNAYKCTLLNPEVLSFATDKTSGKIEAISKAPLQIRNNALGYLLYYDLEKYLLQPDTVFFYGMARFEELQPNNQKEDKKWKIARQNAFYGSLRHFLSLLVQDNLKKGKYLLFELRDNGYLDLTDEANVLFNQVGQSTYKITLEHPLLVIYLPYEKEYRDLRDASKEELITKFFKYDYLEVLVSKYPKAQLSILEQFKGAVLVDHKGGFKSSLNFITHGYWSQERVADLVPIEFIDNLNYSF